MKTANDFTRLVDDLAGHWTESVLQMLKDAGMERVSVEMELDAWRTLQEGLHGEFRWQRSFRFSTFVSLSTLMEQALRNGALSVARKFAPKIVSHEFENRISQLAATQRSTEVERRLYSAIVRRPVLRAAYKEPSRTDFVPRLRVLASAD